MMLRIENAARASVVFTFFDFPQSKRTPYRKTAPHLTEAKWEV